MMEIQQAQELVQAAAQHINKVSPHLRSPGMPCHAMAATQCIAARLKKRTARVWGYTMSALRSQLAVQHLGLVLLRNSHTRLLVMACSMHPGR